MVVIKGVEDNFSQLTHINEILVGDGEFSLHAADLDYGIPGIRLAELLGTGYTYQEPMKIYAPRREWRRSALRQEGGAVGKAEGSSCGEDGRTAYGCVF